MSMTIDNGTSGKLTRIVDNALEGFAGVTRHVRRRIEINRNRRVLRDLPDHILKDIGIARGDINHITEGREAASDTRWGVMEKLYGPNRGRGL
jgi:uncharacterized protein YjiS (DUF1127 family)